MRVLLVEFAQREEAQAVVGRLDVEPRPRVLAQQPGHRDVGVGGGRAELLAVGRAGVLVLVEAMQVGGVRRVDADLQGLQPVALDQPLEGEGVGAGRQEAVEIGEGRCLALAEPGEDDAVLHHHRIAPLAHLLAEHAAFGFGRRFEALAVDVEQPAMEQAAQAAILETAVGEVGAAMRAVAVEQAVTAALVAEQDEILAQHAHRLGRPLGGQFVGEGDGMPVVAHQGAALGAGADPGDQLILVGAHHGVASCWPESWRIRVLH